MSLKLKQCKCGKTFNSNKKVCDSCHDKHLKERRKKRALKGKSKAGSTNWDKFGKLIDSIT